MISKTEFRSGLAAALIASAALLAGPAAAQEWPERPITLIMPWGAGGGTDTVARTLAAAMEGPLGQPVML